MRRLILGPGAGAAVLMAALVTGGEAFGWGSGQVITNFASATFSLVSGVAGENVVAGKNSLNVPNSQSAWVLVTDQAQLCMQLWKVADDGNWVYQPTASPGEKVCFTISYRNCGNVTGRGVTLTDMMPANTMRSYLPVRYTPGLVPSSTWATSLSGPWLTTSPAGESGPLYLRWLIATLGLNQSGYINYCVTVL